MPGVRETGLPCSPSPIDSPAPVLWQSEATRLPSSHTLSPYAFVTHLRQDVEFDDTLSLCQRVHTLLVSLSA